MKKHIWPVFIGVLIAVLAYFLRLQHFADFPPINDTRDEYKYAFNGISLLKNKVPKSWSWFDDYKNYELVNIRGSDYRIVQPYFEDPPLFGLIMGSYAISKGMDSFEKVDAGALRWPMLKIGSLNVFLLFILIYFLDGFLEATIASLLYATIPTMVLSSRLPLAENFLITLTLLSLLLLIGYLKKGSKIFLILLSFLCGMAILVKQSGIYLPVAIILLLLAYKKVKSSIVIVLASLMSIVAWFSYGYYYDWSLFIHMQVVFSGREINLPMMVIHLFDTFRISEKTMSVDGWLIWGWISIAIYSFLRRNNKLLDLVLPLVVGCYLVFFAIMSGHAKGWYRFPFFPFLAWAMAFSLIEAIKNPRFLSFLFFVTIAGFSSLISGTGEVFWQPNQVKYYQIGLVLLTTPFVIFEVKKNYILKGVLQGIILTVFVLAIVLNVRTVLFFQDQFWY